jgi:cellulose synthase operon protein C
MKMYRTSLRLALFAGLMAAGLSASGPALAQDAPSTEDLRALRFYIEQNETTAVSAEIRRLQNEFPSWTPPDDLSALLKTGPTTEVADMYSRMSRGDIAGARRILEQTQAKYPSWQVPSDLTQQLDLSEAQTVFDRAVAARDVNTAIQTVTATPSLLRCDRINNTWNLASLQAGTGNKAGAYVAYRQIVNTCNEIPDLISTIEKSEAVTTDDQLESLLDAAKARFVTQSATFDALGNRLLAGRGIVQDPTAPARITTPTRTPVAEPKPGAAPAPAPRAASNAPAAAAVARSSGSQRTARVQTTLPRTGDGRLSRTISAARSGNFRECAAQSARPRSLDIAYERAWCVYNLERPLEALAYFNLAANAGISAGVTRDARFGMTLAMLKRNMTEEASRIAASTDLTMEQRREVEATILNQRGVQSYAKDDYVATINYFNALEAISGPLPRDLAIIRGYAYLNKGDNLKARSIFEKLHNDLATDETRAAITSTYNY